MRRLATVVFLIAVASKPAAAQIARGVVTERVSGQPLGGVVVSVAIASDSTVVRHGLTNVRGEFAIALGRPGTYVLSAKRIGVARYSIAPFRLAEGETRRFDVVLDQFGYRLPQLKVSGTNLCIPKQDQLKTFVALWDEARTALIASELTAEDTRVSGWLSQY